MHFVSPSHQCQSTEGMYTIPSANGIIIIYITNAQEMDWRFSNSLYFSSALCHLSCLSVSEKLHQHCWA